MRRLPPTKCRMLIALMVGWIVWVQASKRDLDLSGPRTSEWFQATTGGTYPTRDECERVLAIQADALEIILKKRDPEAKRHDKAILSHDASYLYSHEFFCLPDTTDPRGPKGSGR